MMKLLSKIRNDRFLLVLFLIVVISGIFIRLNDFSEVGYWNDDQATIPAGLMWFYPHSYFPGLNYGNPPLGDMIVGAGCMLSGEDFSKVSEVKPFFYPDRFSLLGDPLSRSDTECHLPMYFFGILFFIIIVIFAFTFFSKYSALFLTSFFAFYPIVLRHSRWIKPDMIFWTFIILFIFFLLKYYYKDKQLFLILSSVFLGLAFATKFTAAMLFILAAIIVIINNKSNSLSILKVINNKLNLSLLKNFEYSSPKKLVKEGILFSAIFAFVSLIPYKLNPKNLFETYSIYQRFNQNLGGIQFNILNILNGFKEFLLTLNAIETILFLVSLIFLIKLLFKKEKTKLEIFTLILFAFLIVTFAFFPVIVSTYRAFPFLLSIIFLFALTLEKIDKKIILSSFLVIYIVFSFIIAFYSSPYFVTKNHLICPLMPDEYNCQNNLIGFHDKLLAEYLNSVLGENETFVGYGGVMHYYIRPEQGYLDFVFEQSFYRQIGRYPTTFERAKYFSPNNQTVRYLILTPTHKGLDEESEAFQQKYKPVKIIEINGQIVSLIYDLKNLEENGPE